MICKICGSDAPLHGVVDRARSCEANRNVFFPLRGEAVWYHRCSSCGFLFTTYFDDWTREDWRREVYNENYGLVDPDQADGSRARSNALMVRSMTHFDHRILDYGGGDGTMARELIALGRVKAESWDPIYDLPREVGLFDMVTAFEVFEHSTTPVDTVREAVGFLDSPGVMVFSTLACDALPEQDMSWWYIAPANGHVSIHTTTSLQRMFGDLGWRVHHQSYNLHVAKKG